MATIELALAAAYRKDFGQKNQNIKVEFDAKSGGSRIFDVKMVVEDELKEKWEKEMAEREAAKAAGLELPTTSYQLPANEGAVSIEEEKRYNPRTDVTLTEAQELKKGSEIGDEIRTELEVPSDYGRMAAQTAKQVIIQRLREAERAVQYDDFKQKEGTIVNGTVQRVEGRVVLVDFGAITAVMPPLEQIERERYNPGQRVKVFVVSVNQSTKGPEVIVSRTSPEIVRQLFVTEVPEVASGVVEIKAIARDAGSRTKIAVFTADPNIDPIGACVGQRGTRVQTIIAELSGEKIDIIQFEDDQAAFISRALSPAKVAKVEINDADHAALVTVASEQLSLAIGKQGQNVRLASRLTGWRLDIRPTEGELVEIISESSELSKSSEASEASEDSKVSEVVASVEEVGEVSKDSKPSKSKKKKKS